jgi:hypothetical protein
MNFWGLSNEKFISSNPNLDNSSLSLLKYSNVKKPSLMIFAHTAFGDVSLSDGETLKNLLNGIVKNKLDAVDQLVNSKSFLLK